MRQNQRPRSAATLPNVTKLLTEARSRRVSVIYGVIPTDSIEDSPASLAPLPGEPVVTSRVDKFFNRDLGNVLEARCWCTWRIESAMTADWAAYAMGRRRWTDLGRPVASIRLRTAAPMAASACWEAKPRARIRGPIRAL